MQASVLPADPELSRWVAFYGTVEQKGAELCRNAAASLVPVVALLFAGFVAFLRVSDVSGSLRGWRRELMITPLIVWATAGGVLVWHLLPSEWASVPADGFGIRREYRAFVKRRTRALRRIGFAVLFGIALALGFIASA
jgi:hypothetical protein